MCVLSIFCYHLFLLQSILIEYSTEVFSHHLNARYYAPQIVLICFYIEDI